jgi:mono/diheme cytochrome c family protein
MLQKKRIKINRQCACSEICRKTNPRRSKIFTPSKILKIRNVELGLFVFFLLALDSSTSRAADTIKGGELYAVHCASCHGASGTSVMPNAPNFAQGENLLQPDPILLKSIKNGKNAMPAYQGILSDHDILDVIVYLRTLN